MKKSLSLFILFIISLLLINSSILLQKLCGNISSVVSSINNEFETYVFIKELSVYIVFDNSLVYNIELISSTKLYSLNTS